MKWTNSYRSFGLKTKRSTGLKTIEHKQQCDSDPTMPDGQSGSPSEPLSMGPVMADTS
jgi:hypothetical protein